MKYEMIENKWVKKSSKWKLEWTNAKLVDKTEIDKMSDTFNRITCEKYKDGNKYVVINGINKFEIIVNKGE